MFDMVEVYTDVAFETRQGARDYVKVLKEHYGETFDMHTYIEGDQQGGRTDWQRKMPYWNVEVSMTRKDLKDG